MENYSQKGLNNNTDSLNLRNEIENYLVHWKWFALAILLSLGLAFIYLRYTTPAFSANASILIKDNKKSGLSAELEAFADLGIVGGASANNTDNEIEILKSRKIIGAVVDNLDLETSYYVSGRVKESEVYKSSSPIIVKLIERDSTKITRDTLFTVRQINELNFELLSAENTVIGSYSFDEIIDDEIGKFRVTRNKKDFKEFDEVKVFISPKYKVVDRYRKSINVSSANKNSSVLNLSLQGPVREKAEDILDELVRQYNLDAVNDKNEVSKKTIDFINARIDTVGKQLAIIQDNVEQFKKDKDFTGLPIEAQIALESLKETNQNVINIQIQLSLAETIESRLNQEEFNYDLLPANLGFTDPSISQLIVGYNELVLERNSSIKVAGPKNPVLNQLEERIKSTRSNLLRSLSNVSYSLKLQLEDFKKEEQKVLARVKSIPSTERGFIDIKREQEIISGLYQYLLTKKEETDISLAVTVPNAKIIDVAYSSNIPVSPKKNIIYLAALLLGLLVPFIVIYLRDLLDTKIHHRGDIESEISVPFLGELPHTDNKKKVIVGENNRTSAAEAFRLIRTNLDFILTNKGKTSKTIFITSTMSGEGKSFTSLNVAAILSLSGKKVLLMGMDLRAPKITEYLEIPDRKGVTNYITDESLDLKSLLFQIPQSKNLDILASGTIPPNPAELLMTPAIDRLFDKVKSEYDYIIVDTAPVNLVTDTLLIAKHADMFMYVVRANYLDKRLLTVPEELYKQKKLPNMAIVLNDTNPKGRYGYGGYGYGGYGYGGYGYGGYGSYGNENVQKPWYKKIFTKKS